jgi:methionyl-tRNA formyltransferase
MRIVFMGTPVAAVKSLERIVRDGHELVAVYTQPDRPAGRGNKIAAPPVKEFALANNLPVFQPTKIKTPEALEIFVSHNADVAVVVAYGRILPEGLLNAFPHGAINVHFSLLPKYRGAAPVNWAIVNGETTTGVTTMKMDVGLDTGDILLQREAAIGREETAPELMERLGDLGAELLAETLSGLGEIQPIKQDHEAATPAPIMKKEDGVIDFSLTAEQIINRVRGFQPFPTAHTFYQGKRLIVWKAQASGIAAMPGAKEPGTIIEASGDEIIAACGDGTALEMLDVQLEGKKRMSARDLLNGVKMQPGEKLG